MSSKSHDHLSSIERNKKMSLCGWKNLFDGAFANDSNLSSDKSLQQLEYDGDDDDNNGNDSSRPPPKQQLTEVQKRWWASQQQQKQQQQQQSASQQVQADAAATPTIKMDDTCWKLDMYLTGIPNFDPNNSLYGAKVKISSRDRQDEAAGFALGTTSSDSSSSGTPPTTDITLQFGPDGTCFIIQGSAFTTPVNDDDNDTQQHQQGTWQWMPPDNNNSRLNTLMFIIPVEGYARTITTKGTIQNVAWSNRGETSTKASATYSIPKGNIYGQIKIDYGSIPGTLTMNNIKDKKQPFGLLYVEQKNWSFGNHN
eukprot:CAMPEP_0197832990 /NCGR_PEP_ID=MMETSP1437-20131217/17221_1 /TAXON_ID=49252 ORGANISM="Eucampia antarctica, Strain CCMP1452" /NCGR_SAMPLE_ID=MMETSP1437 /ASSEMBLY_ACC=CAM_ASM_001096 /LENGTH=310 /DNA_ID=CAMNT_0043436705 /DNA_START=182 /DNA_END=1114 /DNA_ORIENTATION=-